MAKELSEQEIQEQFNRQVNYFIMRYMWQVVCGRVRGDNKHTIYDVFQTSRERYTRIINTGVVRYKKGELDRLEQLTGLRKEIFTGEVRFRCPYKEGGNVIEDIAEEEWHTLLDWRKPVVEDTEDTKDTEDKPGDTEDGDKKKKPDNLEKITKLICARLRSAKRKDAGNWDFYRLCYFYENRRPAPIEAPGKVLNDTYRLVRDLNFEVLNGYKVGTLEQFRDALADGLTLVEAIIAYKKAENGSLLVELKRKRARERGLVK